MKRLLVVISCLLLAACAPLSSQSYSPMGLGQSAMKVLAADMAGQISGNNPEKSTAFYIEPDQKTDFGGQLSQALREKGYCVVEGGVGQQRGDEMEIIFTIDWTSPDSLYSSVIAGSQRYTRAYRLVDGKLQPLSTEIVGVTSHD